MSLLPTWVCWIQICWLRRQFQHISFELIKGFSHNICYMIKISIGQGYSAASQSFYIFFQLSFKWFWSICKLFLTLWLQQKQTVSLTPNIYICFSPYMSNIMKINIYRIGVSHYSQIKIITERFGQMKQIFIFTRTVSGRTKIMPNEKNEGWSRLGTQLVHMVLALFVEF